MTIAFMVFARNILIRIDDKIEQKVGWEEYNSLKAMQEDHFKQMREMQERHNKEMLKIFDDRINKIEKKIDHV